MGCDTIEINLVWNKSKFTQLIRNITTTYSQLAHNLFKTCWQLAHNFLTNYSELDYNLFTACWHLLQLILLSLNHPTRNIILNECTCITYNWSWSPLLLHMIRLYWEPCLIILFSNDWRLNYFFLKKTWLNECSFTSF